MPCVFSTIASMKENRCHALRPRECGDRFLYKNRTNSQNEPNNGRAICAGPTPQCLGSQPGRGRPGLRRRNVRQRPRGVSSMAPRSGILGLLSPAGHPSFGPSIGGPCLRPLTCHIYPSHLLLLPVRPVTTSLASPPIIKPPSADGCRARPVQLVRRRSHTPQSLAEASSNGVCTGRRRS